MALVSIPYTFSAGAVIVASQHNACFSTIYSEFNGSITDANISGSAAIAYSKLNLTGNIIDGDLSASLNLPDSKLAQITTSLSGPGGTFTVTNLGFSSSSSYVVITTQVDTGTVGEGNVTYNSGSSFTITNSAVPAGSNVSHTFSWLAIGT